MTKETATRILKFLNEYQYSSGNRHMFVDLPNPADTPLSMRTIAIPVEQVVKFRNDYKIITEFAAGVCSVSVEKFCLLDMIAYLQPELFKTEDEW